VGEAKGHLWAAAASRWLYLLAGEENSQAVVDRKTGFWDARKKEVGTGHEALAVEREDEHGGEGLGSTKR